MTDILLNNFMFLPVTSYILYQMAEAVSSYLEDGSVHLFLKSVLKYFDVI